MDAGNVQLSHYFRGLKTPAQPKPPLNTGPAQAQYTRLGHTIVVRQIDFHGLWAVEATLQGGEWTQELKEAALPQGFRVFAQPSPERLILMRAVDRERRPICRPGA